MKVGFRPTLRLNELQFAARDTKISIEDVPALEKARPGYQAGTAWPAELLLKDAEEGLSRLETRIKQAMPKTKPGKRHLWSLYDTHLHLLQETVQRLKTIVNS